MPKVKLYNKQGKETGTIDLNVDIFGVEVKKSVVHQVYTALTANARQPWAHTKDKSEVRGGGRKPWKQKGTGRARHGSIRSPLWVGGGVTFGPLKTRNYKQKINKKMNQLAVKMCLSDKAINDKFVVLEDMPTDGKAKEVAKLREALPGMGRTTIFLTPKVNEKVNLATRNIVKFDMQQAKDVNVVDLLNHQYVVITKKGLEVLENRLK
ncbi:MAG: 50S ribosomal protein L4 [Candidatus Magasanikbacteria bacterium]|jgi:large subunit ribosomal protein L4|nr:50S ribosomal protein L4 [Candidatus Magasanikbacteria bacterium]MBT4314664.1 50S ribosomal protein L4 [Candidatus Magasanikbacteria bacterium]MBT4547084.1 50S ribosomal protein L4 [Candidatus Magasanikbacteria bacterium]MBT6819544.1 50S ribosomal protein L4 [Candidatus Magasanikbacteria bacterium]